MKNFIKIVCCLVIASSFVSCGTLEKVQNILDKNITKTKNTIEESKTEKKDKTDKIDNTDNTDEIKNEKNHLNSKQEEDLILKKAQEIISSYGFATIADFKYLENGLDYHPELIGKKLYDIVEEGDASPAQFYYDYENNKMYQLNQGMWFIINEDYKNITPKNDPSYESAQSYSQSKRKEKNQANQATVNNSNDILANKKIEYNIILEETKTKADNLYLPGTTTIELIEYENAILKLWDDKLNEIYACLKVYLPENEFKNLEKQEIEWLKYRDKLAETAASEYEGGSLARVTYISSLAESTKVRCYELVNNYM